MRVMIRGYVYDTEKAEKIADLGWTTLMRGERQYFLAASSSHVIVPLCTEEAFNYYQRAVRSAGHNWPGYVVYMDEKAAFGEVEEA